MRCCALLLPFPSRQKGCWAYEVEQESAWDALLMEGNEEPGRDEQNEGIQGPSSSYDQNEPATEGISNGLKTGDRGQNPKKAPGEPIDGFAAKVPGQSGRPPMGVIAPFCAVELGVDGSSVRGFILLNEVEGVF